MTEVWLLFGRSLLTWSLTILPWLVLAQEGMKRISSWWLLVAISRRSFFGRWFVGRIWRRWPHSGLRCPWDLFNWHPILNLGFRILWNQILVWLKVRDGSKLSLESGIRAGLYHIMMVMHVWMMNHLTTWCRLTDARSSSGRSWCPHVRIIKVHSICYYRNRNFGFQVMMIGGDCQLFLMARLAKDFYTRFEFNCSANLVLQ